MGTLGAGRAAAAWPREAFAGGRDAGKGRLPDAEPGPELPCGRRGSPGISGTEGQLGLTRAGSQNPVAPGLDLEAA